MKDLETALRRAMDAAGFCTALRVVVWEVPEGWVVKTVDERAPLEWASRRVVFASGNVGPATYSISLEEGADASN